MADYSVIAQVQSTVAKMKEEQGLKLPPNYSAGNALQMAWLKLSAPQQGKDTRPILQRCDTGSVQKALLDMVIQGLSPAKNQCYFIPYGDQCTMLRSYFGSITVLKNLTNVKDIKAQAVFKGDEFEIGSDDQMNLVVKKYVPKFENRDNPIVGAFAYIEQVDGQKVWTVMTKKEIDSSWSQSKMHNVQQKFSQEMAQRTIINRAAKFFINGSNDNDLFVQAINDTTDGAYDDEPKDVTPKEHKSITDLIGDSTTDEQSTLEPVENDVDNFIEPDEQPIEGDEIDNYEEPKQEELLDHFGNPND
ncbi:recombinase RecT [Levilactobacillus bambusae]|uniref:Recombinase RecT n=1 Tax=Levilactobacillus bambusae TaxID=2024736 RepID=A0A2V1N589_9LACO|nr:RecT family recombinase [Levilactobacillus bambusae]PWG00976.1 recombinase RecT [Levilactobacillus bambusae]